MFRKPLVWFPVLLLVGFVPTAQGARGDWSIGLNGGAGIPVGDYDNHARAGFMGGVALGYAAAENLSIGVDGSFTANDGSDRHNAALTALAGAGTTAKFSLLQGGAHLKYQFPMAEQNRISPYLLVGTGVYNVKQRNQSPNPGFNREISTTKFGARGGLGIGVRSGETVTIGVEGAFHQIATANTSTQLIGLQVGVTVSLSTPQ